MPKRGIGRRQFITHAAGTTAGLAMSQPATGAAAPRLDLPTTSLADLHKAVGAVVASKRIGQPVFVRCTLQTSDATMDRLADLAELVRQWVGQEIERIHAVGSIASGQVCLSLQFDKGGTALVSLAKGQVQGDGVDLLLIGNHGSVMYDAGTAPLWTGPAKGSSIPVDAKLREQIEKALHDAAKKG